MAWFLFSSEQIHTHGESVVEWHEHGVKFSFHGVKFQIHAPWPWKKVTIWGEIHKPPICVGGHIYGNTESVLELFLK